MSPFFTEFTMIKYETAKEGLESQNRSITPTNLPVYATPNSKKEPIINDASVPVSPDQQS